MADEHWQLAGGYRIELFAAQSEIGPGDVIELWTSEGVLDVAEAQRRVAEVLLVAVDNRGRLVGVGTVYVRRNEQLHAQLWRYRTFVGSAHRQSNIAAAMAVAAREHLEQRFKAGQHSGVIGILFTVQSEVLQRHVPQAVWPQTGFVFIGEDRRGAHVRVHWFRGARAPGPDD